jgi:hypothetical protein
MNGKPSPARPFDAFGRIAATSCLSSDHGELAVLLLRFLVAVAVAFVVPLF